MGTIKLPCVRFTRQVSNGTHLSKYGYIGMMERNAEALRSASWRKAACEPSKVTLTVNKVTETDGEFDAETGGWTKVPSYTAFMKDHYDAFKQGGDAVKEMGTMCGYAGMAAYRFTLPTVNPGAISEMKLLVQRDRYLRSGVRVAVELNDSAEPSADWSVIRGETDGAIVSPSTPSGGVPGVARWGFLGQSEVPWLIASRTGEGELVFGGDEFASLADAATAKYLWVYVSLEDYSDYWELYNSEEQRFYSIEGSAQLVASCCSFTFATDAEAPESGERPVADVVWVELTGESGGPSDVSYEIGEVSSNYREAVNLCGSFSLARGLSQLALPGVPRLGAGGVLKFLDGEGVFLSDRWDRAAGTMENLADPAIYVRPAEYGRLFGVPAHQPPGMFFLARRFIPAADADIYRDGCAIASKVQVLLGVHALVVPTGYTSYDRFRLISPLLDSAVRCRAAVNVWRSSSRAFFEGFWYAALQVLASNPALYTAVSPTVSGSADETLWNAIKTEGGVYAADGTTPVSVSVEADLLGSVDVSAAYDVTHKGAASKALDFTGLEFAPGDVLVMAPNVSAVDFGAAADSAHWGLVDSVSNDPEGYVINGKAGVFPAVQFA